MENQNVKGKNIFKARTNAGLTLRELGNKIGVSGATIKRYESGEITNIPSDKIEAIAKATGTSCAYIMGWSELQKENANFHARILKDSDVLEMIKEYYKLNETDMMLARNMISSLANKKD